MTTEMFQGLSETGGSCEGKDSLEVFAFFSFIGENLDSSYICLHRCSRHHNQQSQALFYSTKFNNLLHYSLSFTTCCNSREIIE